MNEEGQAGQDTHPRFNERKNVFVTMFWPGRNIVYNMYDRRSAEFKRHLGNVTSHGKRHGIRKIILFVDHATYHKTANVRKFIKERTMLRVKLLPKKARTSTRLRDLSTPR